MAGLAAEPINTPPIQNIVSEGSGGEEGRARGSGPRVAKRERKSAIHQYGGLDDFGRDYEVSYWDFFHIY